MKLSSLKYYYLYSIKQKNLISNLIKLIFLDLLLLEKEIDNNMKYNVLYVFEIKI